MPDPAQTPNAGEPIAHLRWSRTEEKDGYFVDEDRLKACFYLVAAAGACLLGSLASGLWCLRQAALAPPVMIGIARGWVFSGPAQEVASVRDSDFDSQLSDTVEVLFGRTERGLPPAIDEFCAPEVVAAVDQAYRDAAAKYPAGYVQTLAILESKTIALRPGYRRDYYRGLLSSRSISAAQTSPVYLDCTFSVGRPTALNAAGWRLVHVDAIGRADFYRTEHERAVRRELNLPVAPNP